MGDSVKATNAKRTLRRIALTLVIFLILLLSLALTPAGDWLSETLLAVPETARFDFFHPLRTGKPNDYLVCPKGSCAGKADAASPLFPIPVEALRQTWQELMAREPRLSRMGPADGTDQMQYVQRTPWIGFPDTITVRFISAGPESSTLAIYSHSNYGYSDLGENRRRVRHWLQELQMQVGTEDPQK